MTIFTKENAKLAAISVVAAPFALAATGLVVKGMDYAVDNYTYGYDFSGEMRSESHKGAKCTVENKNGKMIAHYSTQATEDKKAINVSATMTEVSYDIPVGYIINNEARGRVDTKDVSLAVVKERNWCSYNRGNHIARAPIVG